MYHGYNMNREGERVWQAWTRYQRLNRYKPGELLFLHAAAAAKACFVEAHMLGESPDDLLEVYISTLDAHDPAVAEDIAHNLGIMGSLVGRVCELTLIDKWREEDGYPARGAPVITRLMQSQPVEVVASGIMPTVNQTCFADVVGIKPMIEVATDATPEEMNLPENYSQISPGHYAYPWGNLRSISVIE